METNITRTVLHYITLNFSFKNISDIIHIMSLKKDYTDDFLINQAIMQVQKEQKAHEQKEYEQYEQMKRIENKRRIKEQKEKELKEKCKKEKELKLYQQQVEQEQNDKLNRKIKDYYQKL